MKRLAIFLAAIGLVSCTQGTDTALDSVELSSIQCRDAEDNDGDGAVDCDDPDCQDFVFCSENNTDDTSSDNNTDDTSSETDTNTENGECEVQPDWVGAACQDSVTCHEISCDGTVFCHPVFGSCTKGCEPALANEPTVGGCGVAGAVCAPSVYNVPGGHENICAEPCTPNPIANPCSNKDLSCHPEWGFSAEAMTSTCQFPLCRQDTDCRAFGQFARGEWCADDSECPGGECDPLALVCLYDLQCNLQSGRCVYNNPANADVEIGDPCSTQMDCGSGMQCMADDPWGAPEDKLWANGYCTKLGCLAVMPSLPGGTADFIGTDEFDCGNQGTCYVNPEVGGMCLRKCDPAAPSTGPQACRQPVWNGGNVLDAPGDYECYANFMEPHALVYIDGAAGTPDATGPHYAFYTSEAACMPPKFGFSCDELAAIDTDMLNCADSFGGGDTDMQCRDLTTGQPVASGGWCADSTTSSPAGDWISQPDTDSDTDTF